MFDYESVFKWTQWLWCWGLKGAQHAASWWGLTMQQSERIVAVILFRTYIYIYVYIYILYIYIQMHHTKTTHMFQIISNWQQFCASRIHWTWRHPWQRHWTPKLLEGLNAAAQSPRRSTAAVLKQAGWMENSLSVVDLLMENGDVPSFFVYQRVSVGVWQTNWKHVFSLMKRVCRVCRVCRVWFFLQGKVG